jgi:hypothetical protein
MPVMIQKARANSGKVAQVERADCLEQRQQEKDGQCREQVRGLWVLGADEIFTLSLLSTVENG